MTGVRKIDPQHDGAAPVVLLAADSVVTAEARAQLQGRGYRVTEASADNLVPTCLATRPDVVLLDVDAPSVDLARVLAAVHGDERLAGIPVVAIAGKDEVNEVISRLRLGVHDELRKPVDPGELVARIAAALRTGRLERELRRRDAELQAMSQIDHLTGLADRRHLDEHLRMLASAARRQRLPLSVLMVDVDYFRRINDDAGHAAGDEVLRAVACRMSGTLRTEDVAGRWGGEEFLVLLPATDLDGAWISGERIRTAVARTPVALAGGGDVVVTVSVGCATGGGEDPEDQVRRADAALAEAKAAGRNRVVADTTASL